MFLHNGAEIIDRQGSAILAQEGNRWLVCRQISISGDIDSEQYFNDFAQARREFQRRVAH